MSKKIEISKEQLIELTKTKTVSEIAKLYNCSLRTVYNWYKRYELSFKRSVQSEIKRPKKYNYDDTYFEIIDTEHKAYWLGFIMADGCIIQKSKNRPSLSLVINLQDSDSDHLIKFNEDLNGNLPIRHGVNKPTVIHSYIKDVYLSETKYCKIEVNSKWLCQDLIRHGVVQRKTLEEHSPLIENPNLIRHFIRGFFDGDGCFSAVKPSNKDREYPKIFIASGTEIIQYIVNNVFQETGFMMGQDKYYKLDRCYIQSEEGFLKFVEYIYKDATIFLDRKKELIDSYMKRYSLNV